MTEAPLRAGRLGAILDLVGREGTVTVRDLVARVGASPATVRRDLHELDARGLLRRTHGGAVRAGDTAELPVGLRRGVQREAKRRIASAAAARVPDGASVALTGGTTTLEVARRLAPRPGLTVVTNALDIAAELAVLAHLRVIVTGGIARSASYELVGPLADAVLAQLHVDVAFLGVDGIDADAGLTTHRAVDAHTNLVLAGRAARVLVVADATKVGRRALARIGGLDVAHELVTDTAAPAGALGALRQRGLAVTTV